MRHPANHSRVTILVGEADNHRVDCSHHSCHLSSNTLSAISEDLAQFKDLDNCAPSRRGIRGGEPRTTVPHSRIVNQIHVHIDQKRSPDTILARVPPPCPTRRNTTPAHRPVALSRAHKASRLLPRMFRKKCGAYLRPEPKGYSAYQCR